jgi:hypothetical protein
LKNVIDWCAVADPASLRSYAGQGWKEFKIGNFKFERNETVSDANTHEKKFEDFEEKACTLGIMG